MKAKVFLLITDDPDDHVVFSSALDEVSTDAVLMTVSSCQKARLMLEEKVFVPYCVLINLLMEDANPDTILSVLGDKEGFSSTIRIVYGGEGIEFNALSNRIGTDFFKSSVPYTELQQRFSKLLGVAVD